MLTTKITSSLVQGTKYIGTHHGTFHCDEALAIALLKCLPQYTEHQVLRTRDMSLLNQCDIVVDVGGEYNASSFRFDHHQKTFMTTFPQHETKLSSAGLVYFHFGKEIIKFISTVSLSDSIVDLLYEKMYDGFIEHIDGIDNGINVSDGNLNYNVSTTLSSRVSFLNPGWNQDSSPTATNAAFLKAVVLTGEEFMERVHHLTTSWLPARSIVQEVLASRYTVHESGKILKLDDYCPWKSHLYTLEKEQKLGEMIQFVLYKDTLGNMWRIQGVNIKEGGFSLRTSLPEEWRGLRNEELSSMSSIPGCTFVHAGGFIGGNSTYDGALQMAIASLEVHDEESKRQKTMP